MATAGGFSRLRYLEICSEKDTCSRGCVRLHIPRLGLGAPLSKEGSGRRHGVCSLEAAASYPEDALTGSVRSRCQDRSLQASDSSQPLCLLGAERANHRLVRSSPLF